VIYQPPAQCITAYITCRPHPLPHSSPRNIDSSTLSSTLHVSWYRFLLHAHRDASGQTRDIACDKVRRSPFHDHRGLASPTCYWSQRESQIRQEKQRTNDGHRLEPSRRNEGNTARRAGAGAAEAAATAAAALRRISSATGPARPHSSTTPTHALLPVQANQSRLPCPLPIAPCPWTSPSPRQSIIPSTPARRAETPWASIQHPAIPWLFLERGVDPRQHSCQRLGGYRSTLFAQPSILGQPSPRKAPNSLLETKIIAPGQAKLECLERVRTIKFRVVAVTPDLHQPVNLHPAQTTTSAAVLYSNTYIIHTQPSFRGW
jgi:hypothetical protein